jgi:hypothetical protein
MTEFLVKIYNSIIQIVWQEFKYLFDVACVICGTHIKLYWFFILQFVLIIQMVCVSELYV